MKSLLRAWVWYWRKRYGVTGAVVEDLHSGSNISVAWIRPDGTLGTVKGAPLAVLQAMPGLTRGIGRAVRESRSTE